MITWDVLRNCSMWIRLDQTISHVLGPLERTTCGDPLNMFHGFMQRAFSVRDFYLLAWAAGGRACLGMMAILKVQAAYVSIWLAGR